jgi:hypothetical protein
MKLPLLSPSDVPGLLIRNLVLNVRRIRWSPVAQVYRLFSEYARVQRQLTSL